MISSPSPRYILDENVSRHLTTLLQARGREAFESRSVVGAQAADTVVEWIAANEALVVISHDQHFKGIVRGVSRQRVRRTAITLWLSVRETHVVKRVDQCLDLFEYQVREAEARGLSLMYVQLLEDEVNVRYRVPRSESVNLTPG